MYAESELFKNGIHPSVDKICFKKLKWKLSQSKEAKMTVEDCNRAELLYKRLLTLKLLYPKKDFVPSKFVDMFWHEHILDTKAYREDCNSIFGYFLDHYPYFGIYGEDDYQKLQAAFKDTVLHYEKHFGEYPKDLNDAARCEGHACHVPSTCACRTPGACK